MAATPGAAAPAKSLKELEVEFDAAYAALEALYSKMRNMKASMGNSPGGAAVASAPAMASPAAVPRPPVAAAAPVASAAAPAASAAAPVAVAGKTVAQEYMVSDAMIQEFYQKTVSGSGGLPPKGIIMDLVIKHFLGTFDANTKSFTRTSNYKGPPPQLPGKRDLPPAMDLLKEQMKSPAFVVKGGPALDELEKVENDGKGWVWLETARPPGVMSAALYT